MLERASGARVEWDPKDKKWHVHIQVGSEVIKRPLADTAQDASEEVLRAAAVATATNEGYELDAGKVTVAR